MLDPAVALWNMQHVLELNQKQQNNDNIHNYECYKLEVHFHKSSELFKLISCSIFDLWFVFNLSQTLTKSQVGH